MKPGSIIANEPFDLQCVNLTKMDPSRDGKEDVLVLTVCLFQIKPGICNIKSKDPYHGKNNCGQIVLHLWCSSPYTY